MRGPRSLGSRTVAARSLWNSHVVDPGLVVYVTPRPFEYTNPGTGSAEEGVGVVFDGMFPTTGILIEYSLSQPDAVDRRVMEDNMAKTGQKWSRVLVERRVTYQFRGSAVYLSFISWFNDYTRRGESWFDWQDPMTQTTKVARIKGGQLDKETPVDSLLRWWNVSMTLQVWES